MMDSDLAMMYGVETRVLNQAVKRNVSRFPERFCFQLTEDEYTNLKSQFVISNSDQENSHGGRRKLPYVFSEQGIAMLSAVLRSETAIQVSIRIMETFVEIRKYMANSTLLFDRLNQVEMRQTEYQKKANENFEQIFDYIAEHTESAQRVFFDGQVYDAFSFLIDLVNSADRSILLIDNYVDIKTLNILTRKKTNVAVCIYTVKCTRLTEQDVKNFNKQYPELEVKYTKIFHDRFLILDDSRAYHIGASLKDAGKKCFAISRLEDSEIINHILQTLNSEKTLVF